MTKAIGGLVLFILGLLARKKTSALPVAPPEDPEIRAEQARRQVAARKMATQLETLIVFLADRIGEMRSSLGGRRVYTITIKPKLSAHGVYNEFLRHGFLTADGEEIYLDSLFYKESEIEAIKVAFNALSPYRLPIERAAVLARQAELAAAD